MNFLIFNLWFCAKIWILNFLKSLINSTKKLIYNFKTILNFSHEAKKTHQGRPLSGHHPARVHFTQAEQHHLQPGISPESEERSRILPAWARSKRDHLPQPAKKVIAVDVRPGRAGEKWRREDRVLRREASPRRRLVPQSPVLARSAASDLWAWLCASIQPPRPQRDQIHSHRRRSFVHGPGKAAAGRQRRQEPVNLTSPRISHPVFFFPQIWVQGFQSWKLIRPARKKWQEAFG